MMQKGILFGIKMRQFMTYKFAEVNGAKLHYDMQGQGKPLVLIHSGLGHLEMWDDQMPAFAPRYHVIRYDVRGLGKSQSEPTPFSHYGDLKSLLHYLNVEQIAVLGSSDGGGIAIDFTLAYPKMVTALIVVSSSLSGYKNQPDEIVKRNRIASYEAYKRGDLALSAELAIQVWVDGLRRSPSEINPIVRKRALEMRRSVLELPSLIEKPRGLEPPAVDRLAEIRVPTLIVIGDEDVPFMHSIANLLEAEISDAKKVTISNTAHLPFMEKPEQFNKLVLDFLDRTVT
jgi:pimeloyl-ACP methyl ester carboxylesterase